MKIGYPCINRSVKCKSNRTFRLKNYSHERFIETVENNLNCLLEIMKFNASKSILNFRITSDLVPFASHAVCDFNWQDHFRKKFKEIGSFINENKIRISMHPDQFTLINSLDRKIYKKSVNELLYHTAVLDLMGLDKTAKIQIYVGGVYENKDKSIERFVERYSKLPDEIKKRLVIENDDKLYCLEDCLIINRETRVPILFNVFHHQIYNNGEDINLALQYATRTWKKSDGLLMVDYSEQNHEKRTGVHALTMTTKHFKNFLKTSLPFDMDIILEIKDKEKSALKAVAIAKDDERFIQV